jgi:DNA-binding NtrC family response regulator
VADRHPHVLEEQRPAPGKLPTLEEKERAYVAEVLRLTGGNKSAAAEILGITRATLYAKIRSDERPEEP